ncbi:MAG TPA: polysaccharide biosynthesis C-terminal domain-containing protein, partial [Vicinamibacterales bacterium]|nr:polysaccharide biosynthesis C-terminal domain-containing protein [Vicinamibacterales bacterium]
VALLPREVAHATGSLDRENAMSVAGVVAESATIIVWQLPVVAALGFVAWALVGWQWPVLSAPFGIAILVFVLAFPLRLFAAALQGLQDLTYLGGVQLAAWVTSAVLSVALVFAGFGLYGLVAGWTVTQLLVPALAWRRLRGRFPTALPKSVSVTWTTAGGGRLQRGLWVSLNQVAQVLLSGTDLIVVGWLLGPSAVVIYSCTGRLVTLLAIQPQMFMQMAIPALSELQARASRQQLFTMASTMSQAMLLCSGAIACLVLGVNRGFVEWWVGLEHFGGVMLTVMLLISMLLRHLNLAVGYTLYSVGYERHLAMTALADGVLTLLLMWPCISLFGPSGAALASIIGVVVVSLPSNVRALAREAQVSAIETLRPIAAWGLRCCLSGAAVVAIVTFTPPRGLWLVPAAIAIAGLYVASMWPLLTMPPIGPRLVQALGAVRALMTPFVRRIRLSTPAA